MLVLNTSLPTVPSLLSCLFINGTISNSPRTAMPAVRAAASAAVLTLTSINVDSPCSLQSISWITNQPGSLTLWNYFSLLLSEKPRHWRWDFWIHDWHGHHLLMRCPRFMTHHNTHTVNTPGRNFHFLIHSSTQSGATQAMPSGATVTAFGWSSILRNMLHRAQY